MCSSIVIGTEILKYKTNGNVRLFKSLIGAYIRHRIDHMPVYDSSTTTTVALAIPSIIGIGKCNIEFVAGSLELSTKGLQRLLAQEDTNYSGILEKIRENMARRLLAESDASIERIAGFLDYSATAPFTTAFKRWTGQAPLAFRKNERERRAQGFGLTPDQI